MRAALLSVLVLVVALFLWLRGRPDPPSGVRPAKERPTDESDDELFEEEEDYGEAISSSIDA